MLLSNIEDFGKIIPTAADVSWEVLEEFVVSAEDWIRTDILGTTLYNLADGDKVTHAALVLHCQKVIAHYAYYESIPFGDLIQTENGFGVVSSGNLAPASKERVDRLQRAAARRRDMETDQLFEFLEENATYHDAWKGAASFSVLTDCLITTAKELKRYVLFTGDRQEFLDLKPMLKAQSLTYVGNRISVDYLEELIEKQADGDLTADDSKVLEFCKYAIAQLVVNQNREVGQQMMDFALRYMDDHLESFATYTASKEYAARIAPGFENSADNSIFSGNI